MTEEVKKYIDLFELSTRQKLIELREILIEVLPEATETISYKMPAFKQGKVLLYYAGYKNHIGFYPTPQPIEQFKDKLTKYSWSKGAIQFQLDKPLPKKLIQEITLFRLKQVQQSI